MLDYSPFTIDYSLYFLNYRIWQIISNQRQGDIELFKDVPPSSTNTTNTNVGLAYE
jgi:hypothetical protein